MNKVIYIDVETTGTDPERHAVVQIAWITEIDGEVWTEHSMLVQPPLDAEIDSEAMAVHGITQADLNERGVPLHRAVEAMRANWGHVINKYDPQDKATLCAYNLRFDFEFLNAMFGHAGDRYLGSWIQFGRWLDPLYLAAFAQHTGVMPRTTNLRLGTLCESLGIEADDAHDALADIRMTRRVLRELGVRFAVGGDDRDG